MVCDCSVKNEVSFLVVLPFVKNRVVPPIIQAAPAIIPAAFSLSLFVLGSVVTVSTMTWFDLSTIGLKLFLFNE